MKIVKAIPNTITSCNLLCGMLGVIFTLEGAVPVAFALMLGAAVCDFCDGLSARALKAYSDMGKELDSLSDLVSFGVLPSFMLRQVMLDYGEMHPAWTWIPLILAVFSALRLAKFNLDERQHDSFLGLPTPASALLCASLACLCYKQPESGIAELCASCWFLPLLAICLSALLVCEIPMFAMKFYAGREKSRKVRMDNLIAVIGFIVVMLVWRLFQLHISFVVFGFFAFYIVQNICGWIVGLVKR